MTSPRSRPKGMDPRGIFAGDRSMTPVGITGREKLECSGMLGKGPVGPYHRRIHPENYSNKPTKHQRFCERRRDVPPRCGCDIALAWPIHPRELA
jgi:hypothetical protein